MHTDRTLRMLEDLTTTLGDRLRFFANNTCSNYSTVELPREAAARQRRKSKKSQVHPPDANQTAESIRRKTTFNMDTYKHHALGDYAEAIRTYGTCDSYSTEPVRGLGACLENISFLIYSCRVSCSTAQLKGGILVPIGGSLLSR